MSTDVRFFVGIDCFRDRFTVGGAKDDRRDAYVLGDALRTDRHCFRRLAVEDPVVIELREWSRMAEDLSQERNRLANRVREQLWRYYPQASLLKAHRIRRLEAAEVLRILRQKPLVVASGTIEAFYHWARVAIQHDARSRPCYAELRKRGHSHGRALRSVADRLLAVACAMLKTQSTFNPEHAAEAAAA